MSIRFCLQALLACFMTVLMQVPSGQAQELNFITVQRPPFSMGQNNPDGFSIELMRELAAELGRDIRFETVGSFSEMLTRVENATADGAIANISITAAREAVLDFTLPFYESGVQLMVSGGDLMPLWRQVLTRDIVILMLVAVAGLCLAGFLMWLFERRRQPYFERPAVEAMFPSFWWALNLVVNGGFEERQPRSLPGRILGVMMVFSSLFLVSIFVAKITSAITVTALTSTVTGLNDLDTRRVGSVVGSTASEFLEDRSVSHSAYDGYAEVLSAFESGEIDVVAFDGPLLHYYLMRKTDSDAYLVDTVFRSEDYGIAVPTGSPLREQLNQALLTLQENGQYNALVREWFGEG